MCAGLNSSSGDDGVNKIESRNDNAAMNKIEKPYK
jgi:hypothetical protein